MDLGFAAADEAGDWGDDDDVAEPEVQLALIDDAEPPAPAAVPEERLASPVRHPRSPSPARPIADAAPAVAAGAQGEPRPARPQSKIHGNPRTRYFVIKSATHKNLVLSIENNVWATQRHNEKILNEALANAPHVILIFSVNNSCCFQGYAKMTTPAGSSRKTHVFSGYGKAFDVRWLRLDDLDFRDIRDLRNPWNDDKPVKISRDGQELPHDVGRQLCEMVDERVWQGDPANYTTDEAEVDTGGFHPGAAGMATSAAARWTEERPPVTAGAWRPPAAAPPRTAEAWTPPAAAPPGVAPPAPPSLLWNPAPGHPGHQPWCGPGLPMTAPVAAWGNPWASRRSASYSSYSSYSYSDDEDLPKAAARAPPAAAVAAAPPVPLAPLPQEFIGAAPAKAARVAEAVAGGAPRTEKVEKKSKKEKKSHRSKRSSVESQDQVRHHETVEPTSKESKKRRREHDVEEKDTVKSAKKHKKDKTEKPGKEKKLVLQEASHVKSSRREEKVKKESRHKEDRGSEKRKKERAEKVTLVPAAPRGAERDRGEAREEDRDRRRRRDSQAEKDEKRSGHRRRGSERDRRRDRDRRRGESKASPPVCVSGHALVQEYAAGPGGFCDHCRAPIGVHQIQYGCRPCNWCLCSDCYTRSSAGGATRQPVAAAPVAAQPQWPGAAAWMPGYPQHHLPPQGPPGAWHGASALAAPDRPLAAVGPWQQALHQ